MLVLWAVSAGRRRRTEMLSLLAVLILASHTVKVDVIQV